MGECVDMTISKSYSLNCTQCGSEFHDGNEYHYETETDVAYAANSKGWEVQVLVPNGSLWDFCPKCIAKRVNT